MNSAGFPGLSSVFILFYFNVLDSLTSEQRVDKSILAGNVRFQLRISFKIMPASVPTHRSPDPAAKTARWPSAR
jgi:hypothetical protein